MRIRRARAQSVRSTTATQRWRARSSTTRTRHSGAHKAKWPRGIAFTSRRFPPLPPSPHPPRHLQQILSDSDCFTLILIGAERKNSIEELWSSLNKRVRFRLKCRWRRQASQRREREQWGVPRERERKTVQTETILEWKFR